MDHLSRSMPYWLLQDGEMVDQHGRTLASGCKSCSTKVTRKEGDAACADISFVNGKCSERCGKGEERTAAPVVS